MSFFLIRNQE